MFINISTDQVYIALDGKEYFFQRDDVEKRLWPKLIQLAKTNDFSDIVVLNWPWGFTNLRVGALCLNMLNKLFNERFTIYDLDKITLYRHLVQQGALPKKWILYIGQRKNIWDYDFETNSHKQVKKNELLPYIDQANYFLDLVYDTEYFWQETVKITGTGIAILVNYKWRDIQITIKDLNILWETYISANYFIQPILGKQWQ